MKRTPIFILGALVAAQVAVLAAMISGKERTLRDGEVFRFKTRPVDPADPFRGRYVWLGFEDNYIPLLPNQAPDMTYRQPIYAFIATNSEGFAHFSGWSAKRPAAGPYLMTRSLGDHSVWDPTTKTSTRKGLRIEMPFDRFYMDEVKAPRAEQAVWDATRSTNCWAVVRVHNGRAVIEDVYAKGQSIRALVAEKKR
jgi:uncharacterized membrane-anchored protein